MARSHSEKTGGDAIAPAPGRGSGSIEAVKLETADDAFEVFRKQEGQVDFRAVSWVHASIIFLKRTCESLGMPVVGFLIGSGIPIFNYLLALAGSLTFAPLALGLPGYLWIYDHRHYRTGKARQVVVYYLNWLMIALAVFLTVGGTYGVVQNINDSNARGEIDRAFSCKDNSNSS